MNEEQRICDPDHCKSHEYVEKTMDRLEKISSDLTKGQAQIIGVIKDISRLSERVEKLETNQNEIRKFMYKLGGAITVAVPLFMILVERFFGT